MNVFNTLSSLNLSSKTRPIDTRIFSSIYTTGTVSVSNDGTYAIVSFLTVGEHTLALNLSTNSTPFGYVVVGGGGAGGIIQNTANAGGSGGGVSYITYSNSVSNGANTFMNGVQYDFGVGIAAPDTTVDNSNFTTANGVWGGNTILRHSGGTIVAGGGRGGYGSATSTTVNISGGTVSGAVAGSVSSTGTNVGGVASNPPTAGGNGLAVSTEVINDTFGGGGGASGLTGVAGAAGGAGGGGRGYGNNGSTLNVAPTKYGGGGGGGIGNSYLSTGGFMGVIYIWFPLEKLQTVPSIAPSISSFTYGTIGTTFIDLSISSDYATRFIITAIPTSSNTFYELTISDTGAISSGLNTTTTYRLKGLTPTTIYDISVQAINITGASAASFLTGITTTSAEYTAGFTPTISLVSQTTILAASPHSNGQLSVMPFMPICSPKSKPWIIYAWCGFSGHNTSVSLYTRPGVYKSTDYGATFTVIYYGRTWNINNYRLTNICCSDDGRYVYFYTTVTGFFRSSNYGYTWTERRGVGNYFAGNSLHYVSCDSTGRFVQISGSIPNSQGYMYSNNFGVDLNAENNMNPPRNAFMPTGTTIARGSNIDRHTGTLYINGNDLSNSTILYYKEPTGNKFPTTRTWTDISNGFTFCNNNNPSGSTGTGKHHNWLTCFERNIFFSITNNVVGTSTRTDGTAYVGTNGLGNSIAQTGSGTLTYMGFPCLISKSKFLLALRTTNQTCHYSTNNGTNWTPASNSTFTGAETVLGATTVLDNNTIYLYILVWTGVDTQYNFKTVSFTVG